MTVQTPTAADGTAVRRMWPPAPQSVGRARRFLARHLDAWGMPDVTDAAQLIVSELVTNAVEHGRPPIGHLIGVRVERVTSGVRIEVHDVNANRPRVRSASADEESGRGLALVDALTGGQWGVSDREGPGKMVWACVSDTSDAP